MIISDILRLLYYIAFPLFLLPLEFWSQKQIAYAVTSIGVALHTPLVATESALLSVLVQSNADKGLPSVAF